MREISAEEITYTDSRLCIESTRILPDDVLLALKRAETPEASPVGRRILGRVLENAQIARDTALPVYKDTRLTVVFLEPGQDVHITGDALTAAVLDGVAHRYAAGLLRTSAEL